MPPKTRQEWEAKLKKDLRHTLKLVPSSQRDLFVSELIPHYWRYGLEQRRDGEKTGVAYAIQVIDNLHIGTARTLEASDDLIYKGIKNTIRDRFEGTTGVDPAPKYPLSIKLTALDAGKNTRISEKEKK